MARRWKAREIVRMVLMRNHGRSWDEVAEALGRTPGAVVKKASESGLLKNRKNVTIVASPPSPWDEEVQRRLDVLKAYLPRLVDLAGRLNGGCTPDRNFSLFLQSLAALIRSVEFWQTGKERLTIIVSGEGSDASDSE